MANIDIFDCMGFVLTFKHTLLLKKGGGVIRAHVETVRFTFHIHWIKVEMTQALPVIQMTSRRAVLAVFSPPAVRCFTAARHEGGLSCRKSLLSQGNKHKSSRARSLQDPPLCVIRVQGLDGILISFTRASKTCQSNRNWKCAARFRIVHFSLCLVTEKLKIYF